MKEYGKIYGIGINDYGLPVSINRSEKIPEYRLWKDLLKRVYSYKYHEKSPTYIGTTVDARWHSLKFFIEDVSSLKNYEKALYEGYALDKDIIVNGNKHYSLTTCCFVPLEVNAQFNYRTQKRDLPRGVYRISNSGKFACDCKVEDKSIYLGSYDTPEEAFIVRKKFKQKEMQRLAEKYRDILDERVIYKLEHFDYDENGLIVTPNLIKEI